MDGGAGKMAEEGGSAWRGRGTSLRQDWRKEKSKEVAEFANKR